MCARLRSAQHTNTAKSVGGRCMSYAIQALFAQPLALTPSPRHLWILDAMKSFVRHRALASGPAQGVVRHVLPAGHPVPRPAQSARVSFNQRPSAASKGDAPVTPETTKPTTTSAAPPAAAAAPSQTAVADKPQTLPPSEASSAPAAAPGKAEKERAVATLTDALATDTVSGDASSSPSEGEDSEEGLSAKSDEYSKTMNRKMGTSLTYVHENGIDYNRILPDLIVGSCLQTAADVDRLAEEEGVTTIYCLQEDCDMAWFNLDIKPIQERCAERGDIKHVRFPIRDFDPYDLRRKLPRAISRLTREHDPEKGGTIYIHCTAGMGRAPATALAYMNWIRGIQLDEAFALLTSLRRCGPKIEAIRSATSDMLLGTEPVEATIAVDRIGTATQIQVAGLDFGWHNPVQMTRCPKTHRFTLIRRLFPGRYQYKFIVDGVWSYSADHPTAKDGDNINNLLEVIPRYLDDERVQKQIRYLSTGSALLPEEQEELRCLLSPWRNREDPALCTASYDRDDMPAALRPEDW